MAIRIEPATMTVQVSSPRQTPEPASRQFVEALRAGARVLASGAAAAVGALPGAPIMSAAIRGAAAESGMSGTGAATAEAPSPTSPSSGQPEMERIMQESQAFNMYYLEIQEGMSRENRRYSALSNVLKARHETAKSAIGNIR